MRVGIVTFHCAYNFGSALQAWALKHQLECMGHSVRIVDYRGRDFDQYRLVQTFSAKALASSLVFLSRNRRRRDSFEAFISANLAPTARRYGADDEARMEELSAEFDCFVCGSDQIWNIDCTRGPVGPFFLSFAGPARRVAYAPSLSHTAFQERYFGPRERELVASWLDRFDALSVRERATLPLLRGLTSKPIEVCVDPTLLLDAGDYLPLIERAALPSGLDLGGALFVYMLERNDDLVAYASRLARERGFASICYVSKRKIDFGAPARNLYGIGPAEFLAVLAGCRAVVTNSFHATVFSLLFERPFQTFATARSSSRMVELLDTVGASDHLVDGGAVAEPAAVAADVLAPALQGLRARSLAFLERALAD